MSNRCPNRRYHSTDGPTHTAGSTSQSTLQNVSVASAASSSAIDHSQLTAGGGEAPSVLSAVGTRPLKDDQQEENHLRC